MERNNMWKNSPLTTWIVKAKRIYKRREAVFGFTILRGGWFIETQLCTQRKLAPLTHVHNITPTSASSTPTPEAEFMNVEVSGPNLKSSLEDSV
jgi:hypothetical protein